MLWLRRQRALLGWHRVEDQLQTPDGRSTAPSWSCLVGCSGDGWKAGVSMDPAGAQIPCGWRRAEPVPCAGPRSSAQHFIMTLQTKRERISHRGDTRGGGGGLLQGSGGSAELPQPHRRQGVCIFIGVPESVILLRAERLIQLSC